MDDLEPGAAEAMGQLALSSHSSAAASSSSSHAPPAPRATLGRLLQNTDLNTVLAAFLPTRDLFFLQFVDRTTFTLCNSNARLLQCYYTSAHLDSFIPFLVDDAFLAAFLTPAYLQLPDGSRAVRNTYSMHVRHLYLPFCTRISNRSLACVAQHIGSRLLTLDLEGGGRSRINESGMRVLFGACPSLTSLNLNGFYQLRMEDCLGALVTSCGHVTELHLNGCSQMNDAALAVLCRGTGARLKLLHLNCSNVTDLGLQHIACAYHDHLQVLHVGYCGSITDRGVATLVQRCRSLQDLSLYGCTGLSRHALSYLRLCPRLHTVDISRIHALDDASIAEWLLPTAQLQHQQQAMLHSQHPDYNPNLAQIFSAAGATAANPADLNQPPAGCLRSVSLDSCSRVSALGLKILLEHAPQLTSLNAFGVQNLTARALQSLLRGARDMRAPLRQLEIGGCTAINAAEADQLRREFPKVQF